MKRSSARRTLALTISQQGLVVHAPWSMPLPHIERFMLEKAGWIGDKLARRVLPAAAELEWRAGMSLRLLGEAITLQVGAHIGAVANKDRVLYAPELPPAELKDRVLSWYRTAALQHFDRRLGSFAPRLSRQPGRLLLSNARTRWGSCTSDGVVRLNWRLIQASNAEIDYVLAHELAHLTHMNHSPGFWREVERIYPEYQGAHRLLRVHGHRYHQIA